MKKFFVVLLVAIALFTISCQDSEAIVSTNYDVQTVFNSATVLFPNGIVYQNDSSLELDADYLDYYFGNKDLLNGVESYVFVTSPTTSVNEMGVFKITSAEAKDALVKAFETRRDNLVQTHTNYSPEDLEISEGMTIASFDDVVYFIATADNSSVEKIIKK